MGNRVSANSVFSNAATAIKTARKAWVVGIVGIEASESAGHRTVQSLAVTVAHADPSVHASNSCSLSACGSCRRLP